MVSVTRIAAVTGQLYRRSVCAIYGHQPTRLWPDTKDRCLRFLPTRRCRRCGEWVPKESA